MNIYSIKNEKLGFFNRPIYCESEAEALSMIQNILMSDADRALSNLKGDLALYKLGSIDFKSGIIQPCLASIDSLNESNILDNYAPAFICSLEEIFDTIPKDKLKPKLTEEDMKRVYEKIDELQRHFNSLFEQFNTHKHYRKEILK